MSVRTTKEVQVEYNNLTFKLGNLQFELEERQCNQEMIVTTLRALSAEFNSLQAAEQKAAEAKEPAADAGLGTAPTEGSAA